MFLKMKKKQYKMVVQHMLDQLGLSPRKPVFRGLGTTKGLFICTLENSEDPDENDTFHLGHHCLPRQNQSSVKET